MPSHAEDSAKLALAAVISSSEDAIITQDLSGTITSWNRAAERVFGYTEQEAVGQSIHIIVPPELASAEDDVVRRIRDGESVEHYDAIRCRKNGQRIDVSVTASPMLTADGVIVGVSKIARDVTDRKRLERDARHFAAIIDSSFDAIVSKDLNGTIQTWNRAAERLFGYTADEAIGRSIRLIIPDDRQSEEDHVLSRVRGGHIVEPFDTIRVRKDGTHINVSLTVSPIRSLGGEIVGASKIARDVTAQKDAERERHRLLALAQEASRVKDEFLATLSHELRTPLNAILGYSRMLQAGLLAGEKQDRAVDIVTRNATSLSQIVEDVLDVSRIVSGKVRLNVQAVELPRVVREAVDTVRPAIDAKGLRLETFLDPGATQVTGDPERLQQIMWNLLSNAVKFTPRGGRVQVRLERVNSHVECSVSDTGIGIAPEFLPHVFERFRQADAGISRARGGLGLGLAIARHLVELQGGRISVASDGVGKGTTFRIELPVRIVHAEIFAEDREHPHTERHAGHITVPRLQGVRILAVDDDADALSLLREIIEATGATVDTANSGEGALTMIERSAPDLLLADLGLPQMTGFDLIERVRQSDQPKVRSLPAAALTAYGRSEDRAKALRSGFQIHLTKPVDPGELMAAVAALVRRVNPV